MQRRSLNDIYNKLHKGVVVICMGATVLGLVLLGCGAYEMATRGRPQILERKKIETENLLSEGREVLAGNS